MSLLVQPPPNSCKHTSTLLPLLQHRPAVSPAGLSWWTYGRGEVERSGVGGSTAEQMQKTPPGFAEDRPFPSHPAAVQLPRHQLSRAIAPNGLDTSSLCWLVENPVEVVLYSLTVTSPDDILQTPPNPCHYPWLPQTKHAWKCTLPLFTFDHCLTHNEPDDYTAHRQWL